MVVNSFASAKTLSISSDSNGSDDGGFSGLFDGLFMTEIKAENYFSLEITKKIDFF